MVQRQACWRCGVRQADGKDGLCWKCYSRQVRESAEFTQGYDEWEEQVKRKERFFEMAKILHDYSDALRERYGMMHCLGCD